LRARLAEKPDLTMRALAAELRERGTPVTHDTVWRFVRRAGLTTKKRR
jgi:transposase